MEQFTRIIDACFEKGFSDIHVVGNHPLACRKDGQLHFQKQYVFSPQYIDSLIDKILNPKQKKQLRDNWSVDLAITLRDKRLRLNIFSSHRGASMAIRFLPGKVPDLEILNLHPTIREFSDISSGLLLVCGSTGSGKSTTIAAIINEINKTRANHIITLEAPIEYVFSSAQSMIEQREMGKHFHTYQEGLMDVLRQAPDVVVVGEMRTPDTIQLGLDAAESGHLVIATMHAGSHEEVIHRICNSGKTYSQEHTRLQFSSCLVGVIIQQLIYMPKLRFSVPHLSIMRNTKAIANIIRENKLAQLESCIETSKESLMYTFQRYKEEFLDTKAKFIPPSARLSTDPTSAFAKEYYSPLFNYSADIDGGGDGVDTVAPKKARKPTSQDMDMNVDDYISQLENRSSNSK